MRPLAVLVAAALLVPVAYTAAVAVTTLWFERVYMPRIVGDE